MIEWLVKLLNTLHKDRGAVNGVLEPQPISSIESEAYAPRDYVDQGVDLSDTDYKQESINNESRS